MSRQAIVQCECPHPHLDLLTLVAQRGLNSSEPQLYFGTDNGKAPGSPRLPLEVGIGLGAVPVLARKVCGKQQSPGTDLAVRSLLSGCGRDCQPEFRMLVSCLSGQHSLPPKWVKAFTHSPIRSRVGLGARHWPGSTGTVSGNQQLGVVVGFPGNRSKGIGS